MLDWCSPSCLQEVLRQRPRLVEAVARRFAAGSFRGSLTATPTRYYGDD